MPATADASPPWKHWPHLGPILPHGTFQRWPGPDLGGSVGEGSHSSAAHGGRKCGPTSSPPFSSQSLLLLPLLRIFSSFSLQVSAWAKGGTLCCCLTLPSIATSREVQALHGGVYFPFGHTGRAGCTAPHALRFSVLPCCPIRRDVGWPGAPQLQFWGVQPSCVGVRCSVCVGVSNLQMLAYAPPKQQFLQPPHLLVLSSLSVQQHVSQYLAWVSGDWQRVEWTQRGWGDPLQLSLRSALVGGGISTERRKESWPELLLLFLGMLGSCLAVHTSPSQHAWVLVPLVIPLSVKLQLGKGRHQEQSLLSSSGQCFWDICYWSLVFALCLHMQEHDGDGKCRAGIKILILDPHQLFDLFHALFGLSVASV